MKARTLITAHSGADGSKENSMEFVRYALTTRADVLEVDVRRGKDGNLVICHDEVPDEAVSLREVFESVKNSPAMRINCDLKEAGLEETVWKLARENGLGAERILYSGTVSPGGVRSAYHWREVEIFWNVEECIPDVYRRLGGQELNRERIQELITTCKLYEISVINIDVRFLSRELLDAMKKNEIGISVWTVNSADQIRELLNAEVYNITTRNLAAALVLRDEKERL